jgi:glycosyltransferase involved in cell wall biosynthesis
MRILILIDCYFPSSKSGAKHVHDLALEFTHKGHCVTILTLSDTIKQRLQVSHEEGLEIVRVKTGKIKGTFKVLRGIREVRLSAVLWNRARKYLLANPADLLIFYSPSIFFGRLVRRLKSLWHCSTYLILRDIFPQWAVDVGILRKGFIWSYFRGKEIEQYDAADVIAVQSHGDLEYFRRTFREKRYRLEILHNWFNLQEGYLPATNYRISLGLKGKIVFVYGGNLGVAQDVDNLVRLATSLAAHPKIHFLFVGEGSEMPRMKHDVLARGLCNVQFLPSVGQNEYLAMLSEFDVGLITLDCRLTTHNIPGKLFGYMYWAKPVLASLNPGNDLFRLINQSRAGFCFVNGEDENLAAAALRLASEPDLRTEMGRNARYLLENVFSVEGAAEKVIEHTSRAEQLPGNAKSMLAPNV